MAEQLNPHVRLTPVLKLRALKFPTLVRLIRLLAREGPLRYGALAARFADHTALSGAAATLSNSAFYHLLAAAEALDFVRQAEHGGAYVLNERGRAMAKASEDASRSANPADNGKLSAAEIDALRTAALHSKPLRDGFFWLFQGLANDLPLEQGQPVRIETVPTPPPALGTLARRTRARVLHTAWCPPFTLNTIETQSIVFGVRRWCIDLGILDDLVVAPHTSVPASAVQILFTVQHPSPIADLRDFEAALLRHFWPLAEHTANHWSVSVPALLYRLCPVEHLPVNESKRWLACWLQEHRASTFGSVFSPSIAMRGWVRRPADYQALLQGYLPSAHGYISRIGIFDEALARGHFPGLETVMMATGEGSGSPPAATVTVRA